MRVAALFANPRTSYRKWLGEALRVMKYEVASLVPGLWTQQQAINEVDLVVLTGLRGAQGAAARYYTERGIPVVLVELPHLRVASGKQWRITPPRVDWVPDFGEAAVPTDRLDKLGIELGTRRRVKAQSILILGQRSGDSAHGMVRAGMQGWASSVVSRLRALTESPIIWRPHPTEVWQLPGVDGQSDPKSETLAEAFDRSWLAVAYNSTAGLEAMIAGLPVIAEGPSVYRSLANEMSHFARAAPADHDKLRTLLAALAYTQWTPDEIMTGEPLLRVLRGPQAGASRAAEAAPGKPATEAAKPAQAVPAGSLTASGARVVDLSGLSWSALRKRASDSGLQVRGLSRPEVESQLTSHGG